MPDSFAEPEPPRSGHLTRWLLLILSVALLGGGALLKVTPLVEPGSRDFVGGTLFKVGMVVGLVWLAAPQLERLGWQRMRGTGLAIIVVIGVLTMLRPKVGMMAAGMAIGAFLVLALLGWVRGVIFSGVKAPTTDTKTRKIEKNPTRR